MNVPIRWSMKRVFTITVEMMFICSRDSQDPRGYQMDRRGTLRRTADSACIYGMRRFNSCVVSPRGNGQYLVVRQSQLGVTSMEFAE